MTVAYSDTLSPIISVAEFRVLCPGLSATDEQITQVLESVSASIRAYCGWHVSPSIECTYTGNGEPYGVLMMLPAMAVSDVDSLTIEGASVDAFEWHDDGMVRLTEGVFPDSWRSVVCVYTAGYDSSELAHIVAQIASNAIVAAPGVAGERVGDVSVTYNQTGAGITGGVSLLARDKEQLAPYKLVRAW